MNQRQIRARFREIMKKEGPGRPFVQEAVTTILNEVTDCAWNTRLEPDGGAWYVVTRCVDGSVIEMSRGHFDTGGYLRITCSDGRSYMNLLDLAVAIRLVMRLCERVIHPEEIEEDT